MSIELEKAALEACGYRVHVKQRNGTRWLMACKGLQVQYVHWHPLTNINQAMQLLIDCPKRVHTIQVSAEWVTMCEGVQLMGDFVDCVTAQDLINAQCRAIVTACAGLKSCKGN